MTESTKFIFARLAHASTDSARTMLVAVKSNRYAVAIGRSFSTLRTEPIHPGLVNDPVSTCGRYDSYWPTRGVPALTLLNGLLYSSSFNGARATFYPNYDFAGYEFERTDGWYFTSFYEFGFDDITPAGVRALLDEMYDLQYEANSTELTRLTYKLVENCLELMNRLATDLPSLVRARYLGIVRLTLYRRTGMPSLARYVETPSDAAYGVPDEYRGVRINGYDYTTKMRSYRHTRRQLAELGRLMTLAHSDHPDYDATELENLLCDFANSLPESTRSRLNSLLRETLNEPDVVFCDCGHFEHAGQTTEVEGEEWCQMCTDDDAVLCVDTEQYMRQDHAYYSDLQGEWYSYDYDEENSDDDDDDDDDDDEDVNDPRHIMSYSTNVLSHLSRDTSIKSSQFGDFTMGLEFEMCAGSQGYRDAVEKARTGLGLDYCVAKSDGSLPSDGFEIVTAPRGLAEHIERFGKWDIDSRWRAWNTNACGLHVHIDSRAFSAMTLGKFLMFINSSGNAEFIRKLAGRHPLMDNQAQRYCAADGQDNLDTPVKAIKAKGTDRYRMVNCANLRPTEAARLGLGYPEDFEGRYNTIELRIFRASLKKERLLAQVEFAHAAVIFCRSASYRDLTGKAFIAWLKGCDGQYPALAKWYGVRTARNKALATPAETTCEDKSPEPA